jgi:hypothetical protein
VADVSQNQLERFNTTDFGNPQQVALKLNRVLDFLGSRVARIEGTSDREVRLGSIVVPSARADDTQVPTDKRAFLTLGASEKLFSPQVLRQSIISRRWVDGTPVQPLPSRSIDDLIEYLEGTESERLDTDARGIVEGSIWYETDRGVYFIVRSNSWFYYTGVMQDVYASRPTALGTLDVGFLFWAEDYLHLWQFDGANWHVIGGEMRDDFTNRPSGLVADDEGFRFYAEDYKHEWTWEGTAWKVRSGVLRDTLANIPADLTADDADFHFEATDYDRKWYWTGSAWDYQPGYKHFGVEWLMEDPGTGWKLADGTGSPATRTTAGGGTTTFTVPDLIGAFPYGIATYTGSQEAAVAPGLTGNTAADGAHDHDAGTLVTDTAPDHNHFVNTTGSTSSTGSTLVNTGVSGTASVAPASQILSVVATGTSDSDGSHSHDVSGNTGTEPDHTHGKGTLTVDATAKPLRVGLLPYIRQ